MEEITGEKMGSRNGKKGKKSLHGKRTNLDRGGKLRGQVKVLWTPQSVPGPFDRTTQDMTSKRNVKKRRRRDVTVGTSQKGKKKNDEAL